MGKEASVNLNRKLGSGNSADNNNNNAWIIYLRFYIRCSDRCIIVPTTVTIKSEIIEPIFDQPIFSSAIKNIWLSTLS